MAGMIPSSLGKYRIIEEIGRGGMAVVYKAVHPQLGRYVAIKVLPRQFTFEKKFVQRFHREATAASTLSHPNIVIIHDVDQEDDTHYIVMEYLEGQPLSNLIKEQGALPLHRAMRILGQISSALDYAHTLGFVHRDIKPSNIIVGPDDHATLTDFGIVRTVDGTSVTKEGAPIGTPEYMSPEQCDGKQADSKSDIYSLGVVLYEMLTGQVPFTADTPLVVMYQQVNKRPVPPRRINSDLPDAVERVVLRVLAKAPEDRYQTAGELAKTLEAAIRGEELPAPEEPVPDEKAVESLYARALKAVEEKRWQEAIELLNQVLLLDDDHRDARVLLGRAQEGLARQQQLADLKARGEELLKERCALEAIEVFQSALSLQPEDEELAERLARAQQDAEEDEAAKARLRRAEELRERAKRFIGREQWEQAVDCLRQAISLAPANREIESLLTQAEDGLQTQREIEDLYRQGTEALKAQDRERAIDRFSLVLQERPSHVEAREKLQEAQRGGELETKYETAQELMAQAQWPEAIKLFEEILDQQPSFKESHQFLRAARAAMARQREPEVEKGVQAAASAAVEPTEEPGLSIWQSARSSLSYPNARVLMVISALLGFVLCLSCYWLALPQFAGSLAAMLPPGDTSTTPQDSDHETVAPDLVPTYTLTATPSHTATSSPTATPTMTHSPTATSMPTATSPPATATRVAAPTPRPPTPVPTTPTPVPRQAPPGMIYVPAGEATITDGAVLAYEAHYIDDHAVTWGEYQKCVQDTYCSRITDIYMLVPAEGRSYELAPIRDYMPVHRVSWYDADRYCRWAEKRLPTLAEWRNACANATRWNRATLWAIGQLTLAEWVADAVVGTGERVLCLDGCYSTADKSPYDAPASNDSLWDCLRGPDPVACSRGFRCARTVD